MLKFLRGILILAFIVVGIIAGIEISNYYSMIGVVSRIIHDSPAYGTWSTLAFCCLGALLGVLIAMYIFRNLINMSNALEKMPPNDKVAYLAGIIIGLLFTVIVSPIISDMVAVIIGNPDPSFRIGSLEYQNAIASVIRHRQILFVTSIIVLGTAFMYIFCMLMMSLKGEIGHYFKPGKSSADSKDSRIKILDTNVIIDGRIADICRAGFLEGQIYIPGFVLEELQHIADSSDNLKRARGRRGLDILNTLQKDINLFIRTYDALVPEGNDEVDAKLVRLAKELGGIIVTNDFNLNKVAELEGVPVLNVNELANAMKPVVLPGEEMEVTIIKEGKESSQGIGYLDDGTMIVVEGAIKSINETVPVIVTSVLQTVAGKMIFANLKSFMEEEDDLIDRNLRSYSGSRTRKKI